MFLAYNLYNKEQQLTVPLKKILGKSFQFLNGCWEIVLTFR